MQFPRDKALSGTHGSTAGFNNRSDSIFLRDVGSVIYRLPFFHSFPLFIMIPDLPFVSRRSVVHATHGMVSSS